MNANLRALAHGAAPHVRDGLRQFDVVVWEALDGSATSSRTSPTDILRSLIDKLVLSPEADAPNGLKAELHSEIAAILSMCAQGGRQQKLSGAVVLEVASRMTRSMLSQAGPVSLRQKCGAP